MENHIVEVTITQERKHAIELQNRIAMLQGEVFDLKHKIEKQQEVISGLEDLLYIADYRTCDVCGGWTYGEDLTSGQGEDSQVVAFCPDCGEKFWECDGCGTPTDNGALIIQPEDKWLCPKCGEAETAKRRMSYNPNYPGSGWITGL